MIASAAAPSVRALPTALLVATSLWLAWFEYGSIAAADWLPFALLAALVLAGVLVSGGATRPTRAGVVAIASLLALALWATVSLSWSPVPQLARDEGLLTAFYVVALAVPLVTLRTGLD
ncbi:MAG: hypothetical protein M3M94_07215, partial [Actinomycetota bacterium]|nr:hypothetical protein [Actinomycetota bacterium]